MDGDGDGDGQSSVNIRIGEELFDLLAYARLIEADFVAYAANGRIVPRCSDRRIFD